MINKLKSRTILSDSGCWEWQGATKNFGYGYITIGSRKDGSRKTITTHRAMYIATHGEIPNGLWVLHHCDNPKCINPEHLYAGTREDNTRDRESRGRNKIPRLSCEDHPNSKLNWDDVNMIRSISGKSHKQIAKQFNVGRKTIWDIVTYKTWKIKSPKGDA